MNIFRLLGAGALAVLVSSCTYVNIDDVRGLEPQGSDFAKALFAEYVTLADEEVAEYDWDNASKYAAKAQVAAGGEEVGPWDPANFDLPADMMPDFESSRARLLEALDGGGRAAAPAEAAKAQAMYDCWIEEQEEGHQPEDINRCRGAFELALANVMKAMMPMEEMAEPEPAPEEAPPSKFIIYFGFDVAEVAQSAMGVIAEIAGMAAEQGPSKITVQGHADRAGSDDYNLALSAKRAANVAAALEANGVAASTLEVSEFGESAPLVPTDDGVRNPENRRVEIEFVQ
ncbi:MAG: OmpA family protein [Alphaproteobacteria bacterium]